MAEVKLFGRWPSPFTYRVIWALKLKGIEYEYIEEDFFNKSALLLKYNPIYKKVPVLVHRGKPILESMLIIEYIEETWPENPFLPKDPYERSVARFWAKFADDKGGSIWSMFLTAGDALEKAAKETSEFLRFVEDYALGDQKFFGGYDVGFADLAFGLVAHWLLVIEELVDVKVFDAHTFPRLNAWMANFKEVPIVKENLPNPAEIMVVFKKFREMTLASRPN